MARDHLLAARVYSLGGCPNVDVMHTLLALGVVLSAAWTHVLIQLVHLPGLCSGKLIPDPITWVRAVPVPDPILA